MTRVVGLLVSLVLLVWAVLTYPAYRLWGLPAFVQSSIAVLLCLIPAAATLIWAYLVGGKSPQKRLAAALGGSVVRMAAVLGGGMLIYSRMQEYLTSFFWLWVGIYYAATLAAELFLLTRVMQLGSESATQATGEMVASESAAGDD